MDRASRCARDRQQSTMNRHPPTPDLIRSGGYWPTTKTRAEWEALPLSRGTALFTRMPTTTIANESACCRIVRSISLSTIRRIGPIHPELGSLNSSPRFKEQLGRRLPPIQNAHIAITHREHTILLD